MSVSPLQPPKVAAAAPGDSAGKAPGAPSKELEHRLIDSVSGRFEIVRLPGTPLIIERALRTTLQAGKDLGAQVCEWLALDPILTLRLLDATADRPAGSHDGVQSLSLTDRAAGIPPPLLRAMLMSAARSSLGNEPASPAARELGQYWIHSLRVAFLCRSLAEACSYRNPEEAYLAGLLHDLGSFALLATVPNTLRALVATQSASPQGAIPEHAGRLGTIHAQVGAALLETLRLPFYVSDAVLLHHASPVELDGTHPVVRILCCAESLLNSRSPAYPLGVMADLLGISASDVSSADKSAAEKVSAVLRGLGRLGLARPRNDTGNGRKAGAQAPASEPQQNLTETLVMRFVSEAEQSPPSDTPLGRKAGLASGKEDDVGKVSAEDDGWPEALALHGTNATSSSILDQVTARAVQLEASELLRAAGDAPQSVADLLPVARVVAGVKRAALFLANDEKQAWPGWLISSAGAQRVDLEISSVGGSSLAARAAREAAAMISYQNGRRSQLAGLDLQIARMLEADEIIAIPMGGGEASRGGVLIFGTSAVKAPRFAQLLPFLTGLAELVWRSAGGRAGAESLNQVQNETRRLVHEARNPLSVLKTYLQLARTRHEGAESLDKELEIANQELERVARVLDEIGRPRQNTAPRVRAVEINRMIEDMLALYGDSLFAQKRIVLSPMLDQSILPVTGDEEGLKQVLLNLLLNASEALSDGDQVMVCSSNNVNYEGRVMVEISVADNGPGMPPEKVAALFADPEADGGESRRGVGLPTSLGVVKTMGGHLLCRSRLGEGTTFSILLPHAEKAGPQPSAKSVA